MDVRPHEINWLNSTDTTENNTKSNIRIFTIALLNLVFNYFANDLIVWINILSTITSRKLQNEKKGVPINFRCTRSTF